MGATSSHVFFVSHVFRLRFHRYLALSLSIFQQFTYVCACKQNQARIDQIIWAQVEIKHLATLLYITK